MNVNRAQTESQRSACILLTLTTSLQQWIMPLLQSCRNLLWSFLCCSFTETHVPSLGSRTETNTNGNRAALSLLSSHVSFRSTRFNITFVNNSIDPQFIFILIMTWIGASSNGKLFHPPNFDMAEPDVELSEKLRGGDSWVRTSIRSTLCSDLIRVL